MKGSFICSTVFKLCADQLKTPTSPPGKTRAFEFLKIGSFICPPPPAKIEFKCPTLPSDLTVKCPSWRKIVVGYCRLSRTLCANMPTYVSWSFFWDVETKLFCEYRLPCRLFFLLRFCNVLLLFFCQNKGGGPSPRSATDLADWYISSFKLFHRRPKKNNHLKPDTSGSIFLTLPWQSSNSPPQGRPYPSISSLTGHKKMVKCPRVPGEEVRDVEVSIWSAHYYFEFLQARNKTENFQASNSHCTRCFYIFLARSTIDTRWNP